MLKLHPHETHQYSQKNRNNTFQISPLCSLYAEFCVSWYYILEMLWIWFSTGRVASHRMLKMESLASFQCLCSQIQYFAHDSQSSFSSRRYQKFPNSSIECFSDDPQSYFSSRIILTPRIVHKTISNCRSDILAFSFFLWCGKQHNYFHDRATLTHMISIVSRLTQRLEQ